MEFDSKSSILNVVDTSVCVKKGVRCRVTVVVVVGGGVVVAAGVVDVVVSKIVC
jgi:hypothetical protein